MSDIQIEAIDESEIVTILAEDIQYEGVLAFSDSLMIKGEFKGKIIATGDLYVDENAVVEAKIKANSVSLKGKVIGDVYADARVELFASAQVDGDITAPDIIMESGCQFNGICKMQAPPEDLQDED